MNGLPQLAATQLGGNSQIGNFQQHHFEQGALQQANPNGLSGGLAQQDNLRQSGEDQYQNPLFNVLGADVRPTG